MSIRKRTWSDKDGKVKQAFVVDYFDQHKKRHIKTFKTKEAAKTWAATTVLQVKANTHVPDSKSITVEEATKLWIGQCELDGLEPTTIEGYKKHQEYIVEYIGNTKLNTVAVETARYLETKLRDARKSANVARAVVQSLGAVIAEAVELGKVTHNPLRERRRKRRGAEAKRHKQQLKPGVDMPLPDEMRKIIESAPVKMIKGRPTNYYRVFIHTAAFTGLRASELRGLRWEDVDLKEGYVNVTQRADRSKRISSPKSDAGRRRLPIPSRLLNELREWKLVCPKLKDRLVYVFPTSTGQIEYIGNLDKRGFQDAVGRALSLVHKLDDNGEPAFDEDGEPILRPKYTGLHCLRHFYASYCINRKIDGGLELPAKIVQARLGHSSITLTLDRYGHLFPSNDDREEMDAANDAFWTSEG
ncbi:site-specific integrase [Mesorhizobium argentiipisi]|uniref:Site-specific integrase n=1 Tax=Mesorhizobium argentiipisi TaxID=3015175 RepID=A0ABU8KFJ1_9HYPH